MLAESPLCCICRRHATEVDHIIPAHRFDSVGEANARSNLRSMCRECHRAKTLAESKFDHPSFWLFVRAAEALYGALPELLPDMLDRIRRGHLPQFAFSEAERRIFNNVPAAERRSILAEGRAAVAQRWDGVTSGSQRRRNPAEQAWVDTRRAIAEATWDAIVLDIDPDRT